MGNTIASIFSDKNKNSDDKINDDSVAQWAKYIFNVDPKTGSIVDLSDIGKTLKGNPKTQDAIDALEERYRRLHP
jgi:hypothetical protein